MGVQDVSRFFWCWIVPVWLFRVIMVFIVAPLDALLLGWLFPRYACGTWSATLVALYEKIMRLFFGYGELFRASYAWSLSYKSISGAACLRHLGRIDQAITFGGFPNLEDPDKIMLHILKMEHIGTDSMAPSHLYALKAILLPAYCQMQGHINTFVARSRVDADATNPAHQEIVRFLWKAAFNENEDCDFTLLGFQQKKPWSDFRSVGILGAELLLFYANTRPHWFKAQLSELLTPDYPLALIALHIANTMLKKLKQRDPIFMDRFYSCLPLSTQPLHLWFCYAMFLFHRDWRAQSRISNIMDFEFRYYQPYWVPKRLAWMDIDKDFNTE